MNDNCWLKRFQNLFTMGKNKLLLSKLIAIIQEIIAVDTASYYSKAQVQLKEIKL